MNNDSKLLAEAYKVVRENMPYPVFAKLSKHASPGSHKDEEKNEKKKDRDAEDKEKDCKEEDEQGPIAAGFQGMTQGIAPYAAGAVAGAKQLGQNLAGAVTGSQQVPQNPIAVGQQAFTQEQIKQAVDGVIKAFNVPPEWERLVSYRLNELAAEVKQKAGATTQRYNQYQANKQLTQPAVPTQTPAPRV